MKKVVWYLLSFTHFTFAIRLCITREQAQDIGHKVWRNESNCSIEKLIAWHPNEHFISCGINHCIWFPHNYHEPFKQQFPALVHYFKQNKQSLPSWLTPDTPCPWQTRQEFLRDIQGEKVQELRTLLQNTIDLQIQFLVKQLEQSYHRMRKMVKRSEQNHLKQQFNRLAQTTHGLYILIDYCNFKGDGTAPQEQYNGHHWGLLHVLLQMKGKQPETAYKEFVDTARALLQARVNNAPSERNEQAFLQGWFNRLDTYCESSSCG